MRPSKRSMRAKSSPRARPSHTSLPDGRAPARGRRPRAGRPRPRGGGAPSAGRGTCPARRWPRAAARRVEAVRHVLDERRAAAEGEALDVVRRRRAVAPIDQPLRDATPGVSFV